MGGLIIINVILLCILLLIESIIREEVLYYRNVKKILRKIYGPVCKNKQWRIRNNMKLDNLMTGENIP